jgi:hypothetical protein
VGQPELAAAFTQLHLKLLQRAWCVPCVCLVCVCVCVCVCEQAAASTAVGQGVLAQQLYVVCSSFKLVEMSARSSGHAACYCWRRLLLPQGASESSCRKATLLRQDHDATPMLGCAPAAAYSQPTSYTRNSSHPLATTTLFTWQMPHVFSRHFTPAQQPQRRQLTQR